MNKVLNIVFIGVLTLILIIDYFPDIIPFNINNIVILTIFFLLIIASFFLNRKQSKEEEYKETYKFQLFTSIYIFLAVLFLTLIGGQSNSAISLSNPAFWIAIAITLADAYSNHQKLKKKNTYS
ncbi:hypothetical protein [Salinicoccus roseus]|uniref:Uncharacterized protein n=1 Tax=Salinicoccus roseus TaxID=45670 RepID=A0A265E3S6_9STAP|nr:hypothetical protein [Salinicoccus roseus]OZT76219.1 hypothetical protein CFN03_12870 [Salinicoccus roseus]